MAICQVGMLGLDAVAGMGRIDSAARAREYAPLTGREPELVSAKPAWMIQFRGEVPQLRGGEVWIDPVCIVIDGAGGFYATGPVILQSGRLHTPEPVPVPPSLSLPPLGD